MLQVRKDLCLGCGICIQSCPRGAVSFRLDRAEINQSRCNSCHLCLDVCPQGAIAEVVPVSQEELKTTVSGLKLRVEELLMRIEGLKQ
jgi:ferredoxin